MSSRSEAAADLKRSKAKATPLALAEGRQSSRQTTTGARKAEKLIFNKELNGMSNNESTKTKCVEKKGLLR